MLETLTTFLLEQTKSYPSTASEPEEKHAAPASNEDYDNALAKLENMIGLKDVKRLIRTLASMAKINFWRIKNGLPIVPLTLHSVFIGNPGTGKTMVARAMANILHSIGTLSEGKLIEVGRADLVAEYIGQTAVKTNSVIDKAIGGIYSSMKHIHCATVRTTTMAAKPSIHCSNVWKTTVTNSL